MCIELTYEVAANPPYGIRLGSEMQIIILGQNVQGPLNAASAIWVATAIYYILASRADVLHYGRYGLLLQINEQQWGRVVPLLSSSAPSAASHVTQSR